MGKILTDEEIATQAQRAVDRVLSNNIQVETCPEKKRKAEWKREKVVAILVAKLGSVGPSQTK